MIRRGGSYYKKILGNIIYLPAFKKARSVQYVKVDGVFTRASESVVVVAPRGEQEEEEETTRAETEEEEEEEREKDREKSHVTKRKISVIFHVPSK